MKHVGDQWKNLTEEQKQPYKDKSTADQERYKKEMAAYVPA